MIADRRLLIGSMGAVGANLKKSAIPHQQSSIPPLSFLFFNIAAIFLNTEFFLLSESSV
jgi:hypothetical protein